MPLGQGYTAEEQLTGEAKNGGIQLLVHPLKPGIWRKRMNTITPLESRIETLFRRSSASEEVGLAPGGRISQEIAEAVEQPSSWDLSSRSRCYVHLAHAEAWQSMAGQAPHHQAPTAADYTAAGLPWFDWSSAATPRKGSTRLGSLASVRSLGDEAHEEPLGPEETFDTPEPILLGRRLRQRPQHVARAQTLGDEQRVAAGGAVAAALKGSSSSLIIAGFTDERGTAEYNRGLGERRAQAVRQSLIEKGLSASQIQTVSFGSEMPVDSASNESAWAKNRRAEFGVGK
jgi:hypothetical protein